ncbi:pentapeptide repeat-containing protein [Nocardia sp. JW2]|uniref:pentapeptide repeat-containing protein n=1 Tax=Nocardia sp. JW2 TaxID=3450738 RepID=UPI003F43E730
MPQLPLRRPALRRAELRRAALRRATLRQAVLRRAVLRRAALRQAVLRRAVLRRAVLRRAVLRRPALRRPRSCPEIPCPPADSRSEAIRRTLPRARSVAGTSPSMSELATKQAAVRTCSMRWPGNPTAWSVLGDAYSRLKWGRWHRRGGKRRTGRRPAG